MVDLDVQKLEVEVAVSTLRSNYDAKLRKRCAGNTLMNTCDPTPHLGFQSMNFS